MRQTSDGLLWLATAGGVNRLSPDLRGSPAIPLEALRLFVGPLRLAIHAKMQPCVLDGNNRLLVRWIANSWQPLSLPLPTSQGEEITAIENDDQGALWLGTRHSGVFRFDGAATGCASSWGLTAAPTRAVNRRSATVAKRYGIGEIAKLNSLYQQTAAGPEGRRSR